MGALLDAGVTRQQQHGEGVNNHINDIIVNTCSEAGTYFI